jgi:hypothetical protein
MELHECQQLPYIRSSSKFPTEEEVATENTSQRTIFSFAFRVYSCTQKLTPQ